MFTVCQRVICVCACGEEAVQFNDLKKPNVVLLFLTNNKKTKGNICDSENDNDGGNQDGNGGEY